MSDSPRTYLVRKKRSLLGRLFDEVRTTPPIMAPLVLGVGIFLYMVNLREAHFTQILQLAIGWGCLAILFVLHMVGASRTPVLRLTFILVAAYIGMRYLWWRTFETLIYTNFVDFIGMSLLFAAELYSITVHLLGLFVNLWPLEREEAPLPEDRSLWPTVDIFIPTYSESEDISRLTALAGRIQPALDELQCPDIVAHLR